MTGHDLAPGVHSHDYGDAALLLEMVGGDREERWGRCQALGQSLRRTPPRGLVDVVASIEHVFVAFDPLLTEPGALREALAVLLSGGAPAAPTSRQFTIPVVYGGEHGPDLDHLADLLGLEPEELVARHERGPWTLRFVGSPAGAPMLDGPEHRPVFEQSVPRVASPRARLAAGSVGLSGSQCIVYNAPSPGGWQIIGRTPALLFDLDTPPHVPYRAGDLVRFRGVDAADWDRWTGPLNVSDEGAP